jgi:hypothetical protein
MSAIIVPSSIMQLRRAERRKAATLEGIAALRSNIARIGLSLGATQECLNRVSVELDQAAAGLHYSRLFSKRCEEIMASGDLAAMISMRDSLLRSPLADEVLGDSVKSQQLALISPTAR